MTIQDLYSRNSPGDRINRESADVQYLQNNLLQVPVNPTINYLIKYQGWETHFNVYSHCKNHNGEINTVLLESAVRKLIQKHDGLRLRLHLEAGVLTQWLSKEDVDFKLETIDLRSIKKENQLEAMQTIASRKQKEFVLDKHKPLYRIINFQLSVDNSSYIFFIFHHFIMDGYSLLLAMDELESIYQQLLQDDHCTANFNRVSSNIDWLHQLNNECSENLHKNLLYWTSFDWDRACNFNFQTQAIAEFTENQNTEGVNLNINKLFGPGSTRSSSGTYYGQILPQTMADFLFQFQDQQNKSVVLEVIILSLYKALEPFSNGDLLTLEMVAGNRRFAGSALGNFVTHNIFALDFARTRGLSLRDKIVIIREMIAATPLSGRGLIEILYGNHSPRTLKALQKVKLPDINFNIVISEEKPKNSLFRQDENISWGERESRKNPRHPNIQPLFFHIVKHQSGLALRIAYQDHLINASVVRIIHQKLCAHMSKYIETLSSA